MDSPFTPEEDEIMQLLVQAHNKFILLPPSHPNEQQEWATALHRLQDLIGHRVLKRNYPDYFT